MTHRARPEGEQQTPGYQPNPKVSPGRDYRSLSFEDLTYHRCTA